VNKPTINREAIHKYTAFSQHITEVCIAYCGNTMTKERIWLT